MNITKRIALIVLSLPLVASAQMTTPSAGLVPGNFLYFLDRFSEGVVFFYTFKSESRARLALEYAQERIAELNQVLLEDGIDSKHVAKAKDGFDKEIARAAGIVKEYEAQKVDLASCIDKDIEASRESLKTVYHNYHESLKKEGNEIRAEIERGISDEELGERLSRIDDEILGIMNAEDELHGAFEQEKEHLVEVMGSEQSAKSHIANALRARERFIEEMKISGVSMEAPAVEALAHFDETIKKANAALVVKDFEGASDYAKDAQWTLNDARNELDMEEIEKIFFGGDDSLVGELEEERRDGKGSHPEER